MYYMLMHTLEKPELFISSSNRLTVQKCQEKTKKHRRISAHIFVSIGM